MYIKLKCSLSRKEDIFIFEFEILQELELNAEILEIIKYYDYTVKNGRIKHLKATNLQFIEPNEYLITYPLENC